MDSLWNAYVIWQEHTNSKMRCKNENIRWQMDYRYTFDSILQGFQGNASTSTANLVSFFFSLKIFFSEPFFFKTFFKFSNNGIKYFTVECFFSDHLHKGSIKLFAGSARISQKRFVSRVRVCVCVCGVCVCVCVRVCVFFVKC